MRVGILRPAGVGVLGGAVGVAVGAGVFVGRGVGVGLGEGIGVGVGVGVGVAVDSGTFCSSGVDWLFGSALFEMEEREAADGPAVSVGLLCEISVAEETIDGPDDHIQNAKATSATTVRPTIAILFGSIYYPVTSGISSPVYVIEL